MKHYITIIILGLSTLTCQTSQNSEENNLSTLENNRYDLSLTDKLTIFKGLREIANNKTNPITEKKVKLGKLLYFDPRLSAKGNVSCNSCHNLKTYGVDNLQFSPGDDGKLGGRNSPTVFNSVYNKSQFWDGRAKDLEEQAGMPILNPIEMAIPSKDFLVKRLSEIPEYRTLFTNVFPESAEPITYQNITYAIAAFERKLITTSRFEEYLKGNTNALSLVEKKGLSSFINVGCSNCHNGALLGGNAIKKFGERHNYWKFTKSSKIDIGLAEVTKNEEHQYMFKVPSLKNVEKTAPYFHDGSVKDLETAIEVMAKTQLDLNLTTTETKNIAAFLKSLTGDIPKEHQELTEDLPL